MKTCPQCAERIQDEAVRCRFCGAPLVAQPPSEVKRLVGLLVLILGLLWLVGALLDGQTIGAILGAIVLALGAAMRRNPPAPSRIR